MKPLTGCYRIKLLAALSSRVFVCAPYTWQDVLEVDVRSLSSCMCKARTLTAACILYGVVVVVSAKLILCSEMYSKHTQQSSNGVYGPFCTMCSHPIPSMFVSIPCLNTSDRGIKGAGYRALLWHVNQLVTSCQ